MTHCPQCGAIVAPGVRACAECGLVVALVQGFEGSARSAASRTILGGIELGPLRQALPPAPPLGAPPPLGPSPVTEPVGPDLSATLVDPPRFEALAASPSPGGSRTLLGVASPAPEATPHVPPPAGSPFAGPSRAAPPVAGPPMVAASDAAPAPGMPQDPLENALRAGMPLGGNTLLGVATPGIAPLHPGREAPAREAPQRAVAPLSELGATAMPAIARKDREDLALAKLQLPAHVAQLRRALRPKERRVERPSVTARRSRAVWLLAAAAALVLGGVLAAVFWPRSAPLALRVTSREGADVLAFECAACPDGTILRAAGAQATVRGGKAEAPAAAPLPVGETIVRVEIDRPGEGRDEVQSATARVSFRVRLDLATLAGQTPSISVVVEAAPGARVTVDGSPVDVSSGTGTRAVDVTAELTGGSLDAATLTRKIPFTIEPKGAPAESGVLTAQVAIVPLRIDAPGPTIVTDRTTFVLAGRTSPTAELTVAGHPIAVKKDGSFAHVMSVSTTGATIVEVRASSEGKAPRIEKVAVERVATLEEASRRFRDRKPLSHADVVADPAASRGKPIVVTGEILEVRRVPYQTIAVVNVDDGCKASCLVRVVIGADAELAQGARATFYGQVAGAFAAGAGPAIPAIDAAFFEVRPK